LQSPHDENRPFWKRHFRAILWGIAIAGVVVSFVTGFKYMFLFLPLIVVPTFVGGRNGGSER
jgi:hypothetical protein